MSDYFDSIAENKQDDWSVLRFKETAEKISDRDHFTPTYVSNGIPIISPKDFDSNERIQFGKCKFITLEAHEKNRKKTDLETDDIVFTRIGAGLGKSCLVTKEMPEFSILHSAAMIRVQKEKVKPKYFLYYLKSELLQRQIGVEIQSIGVPDLGLDKINDFKILLPPSDQQQKIAKILTTIDQLIEKTQALIDKHTAIKQGMMADLFTRGIDLTTGQLRPQVEQAPHLYKETELGWIPKDWDINKLSEYFSIKHGHAFEGEYFADKPPGDILLTPGNFHRTGGLYFTNNNTKYFTGEYSNEYVLGSGDYLVVMTDLSPQTLILGRFVYLDDNLPLLHNQRIGKLIAKQNIEWNKDFLIGSLNQESFRKNIILTATGTTVRHTSPDRILDNYITVPNINEQKAIGKILDKINTKIKTSYTEITKYNNLKNGLMQDLLTGKVKVN